MLCLANAVILQSFLCHHCIIVASSASQENIVIILCKQLLFSYKLPQTVSTHLIDVMSLKAL